MKLRNILLFLALVIITAGCIKLTNERSVQSNIYKALSIGQNKFLLINRSKVEKVVEIKMEEYVDFGRFVSFESDNTEDLVPKNIKVLDDKISGLNISFDLSENLLSTLDNVSLVDVRTFEEYSEGHIKNSQLLPLDTLTYNAEKKLKKENLIILYCRSGNRSGQAQKYLEKLGYTSLNAGGINSYKGEIVR
ncbi:MAG: rhodanese-like domain-containing protein [Tissierellia bacterium]|nr:rhodanese-like domain-containing protein [Tissierellia bacterium]